MSNKVPEDEELYNLITHKYKESLELINHLLDVGEDIFIISNGKNNKDNTSKDEKEFYSLILKAKEKLYLTREKVLTKRYWNSFGRWSLSIKNKYESKNI
jgi:hypothetical protein